MKIAYIVITSMVLSIIVFILNADPDLNNVVLLLSIFFCILIVTYSTIIIYKINALSKRQCSQCPFNKKSVKGHENSTPNND